MYRLENVSTDLNPVSMGVALNNWMEFQELISNLALNKVNASDEQLRETGLAIIIEIGELLQELGWKSWKDNPELTEEQLDLIAEEFADVMAFMGLLMTQIKLRTGISGHRLAQAYLDKSEKNIRRFTGQSDEAGYGPKEERNE